VVEGYGLTEAAPICAVRLDRAPVPYTIGPIMPEMEMKILDPEGRPLKPGEKGILYVKGPNVMKGYYKQPEKTDYSFLTHIPRGYWNWLADSPFTPNVTQLEPVMSSIRTILQFLQSTT
jgi:long-subunit acyl-CoA synthetase (AMP-forming)